MKINFVHLKTFLLYFVIQTGIPVKHRQTKNPKSTKCFDLTVPFNL